MAKRGPRRHPALLTPREQDVLALLREGLTNPQIAERLNITPETAKYHVSEILSKLNLTTREQAATWTPKERPFSLGRLILAAACLGTLTAVVAGLGLLSWGISRSGSGAEDPNVSATPCDQARACDGFSTPSPGINTPVLETPDSTSAEVIGSIGPAVFGVDGISADYGNYLFDTDTGDLYAVDRAGSWSPDGNSLLVANCCVGGGLVVIDIESGEGERLAVGSIGAAAWSPDGTRIAFTSSVDSGGKGLFLVETSSGKVDLLAQVPWSWRLAWSVDGAYIALTDNTAITAVDVASGSTQPINDNANDFSWSPIDSVLAYANDLGLHLLDMSTGTVSTVLEGPVFGSLSWSPDGSRILVGYGDRVPFRSPMTGGVPLKHIVTVSEHSDPVPLPPGFLHRWSPDGSFISYESYGCITGEWDAYVVDADGTNSRRITHDPEEIEEGPVWSPDGTLISMASFGRLFSYDLRTDATTTLVETGDETDFHLHGEWSPNGRYVPFTVRSGHGTCD